MPRAGSGGLLGELDDGIALWMLADNSCLTREILTGVVVQMFRDLFVLGLWEVVVGCIGNCDGVSPREDWLFRRVTIVGTLGARWLHYERRVDAEEAARDREGSRHGRRGRHRRCSTPDGDEMHKPLGVLRRPSPRLSLDAKGDLADVRSQIVGERDRADCDSRRLQPFLHQAMLSLVRRASAMFGWQSASTLITDEDGSCDDKTQSGPSG